MRVVLMPTIDKMPLALGVIVLRRLPAACTIAFGAVFDTLQHSALHQKVHGFEESQYADPKSIRFVVGARQTRAASKYEEARVIPHLDVEYCS